MLRRIADAIHELRIRRAVVRLQQTIAAAGVSRRRLDRAHAHLQALVRARSPAEVARMERDAYNRLSPADRAAFDCHQASERAVRELLRAVGGACATPNQRREPSD